MLRRDRGGRTLCSHEEDASMRPVTRMAAPASGYEYIVTGVALLLAVGLDPVVRRGRAG